MFFWRGKLHTWVTAKCWNSNISVAVDMLTPCGLGYEDIRGFSRILRVAITNTKLVGTCCRFSLLLGYTKYDIRTVLNCKQDILLNYHNHQSNSLSDVSYTSSAVILPIWGFSCNRHICSLLMFCFMIMQKKWFCCVSSHAESWGSWAGTAYVCAAPPYIPVDWSCGQAVMGYAGICSVVI